MRKLNSLSFILTIFEIELFACTNKLWKMCAFVCDVVRRRRREGGCVACGESGEIKTFMKYLFCHRGHGTHIIRSNMITERAFLPNYRGYITTLQSILDDTLLLKIP